MKLLPTIALSLLLGLSGTAMAGPDPTEASAGEIEAGKLLDTMNMDRTLQAMLETMLDMELNQKPELEPYRQVMSDFFAKHMSYAMLRDELAKIYADEFSADELRAAREFYSTPAGRRFLEVAPRLVQLGAELGTRRVQENLHELQTMVRAEQARLAKLQSEAELLEDIAGKKSAPAGKDRPR